ncbi:hypothetical protein CC78DRAFT_138177 [Lojkania enalia]|uniref:Uncharacterized protein n=1 Tax=Lojkania enalia TaxID=147567 RepID=A0A9P4TRI8_9PLEO|nr:hypothetical protein CC78DRAFT_138177 [Didymosphaeria enalia]
MSTIRPSYARSKSHKQRSRPWSRNDCSNQAPCGPPAPEWGGAPSKSPPPPYSTLPDFMCNAFRKEDNRYGSSFKTTKTSSKTSERPSAREKGDLAAKTSWNLQNKENTDKLGGRVEEDLGTKEDSWNNIDGWGDGNSNSESSWGDASDGPPVPGAWDNSDRKDGQNKLGKDAGAANGWGIQNNENNNNSGRWGQVNSVNGGIGQSTKGENKKDEIDQNNNDWGSGNNDSNAQDTNGNGGWSRQNQTGQGNVWRGSTNTNFSGWGNQNNDSNNQNSQGQGWDKQDDTSGNNQAGQVDLNQGNDKLNVQNNSRNHCDKNNDSSNDQNKNSGAGTWNMGFDNKNINTEEKKNQPGEQAWNNDISNDQNNGFGGGGRGDNNDSDNKPDERSNIDLDNDAKLGKHSPTKSRLKSYRRRSKPTNVEPQAYWSFPPPQGKELQHGPQSWDDVDLDGNRNMYSIPEGPLAIPEDKAKEKLLDHQVKEGKGMLYEHCVGRPKYLDSLQKPVSMLFPHLLYLFAQD